MIHTYSTRIKIQTGSIKTLVALLLLILLTQVLGDNRIQRPKRSRGVPVSEAQKDGIARGLAENYGIHRRQDSQGQNLAQQFKRITEFAITRLQPTEREAIRLRFMDGLGPKEAAKKAGCSIGAFYKRLERAERALREAGKNKKD